MKILVLFFIGVLQGFSEFLPISSSGHIVLFSKIFKIEESLILSVILHCATLLSILVVYRKDVWQIIKHPFSKQSMLIAIATIPTCLVAVILMPVVKIAFGGNFLPICFLLSAVILFLGERVSKTKNGGEIKNRDAFLIGLAQGFAVFPGISRSGTTVSTALFLGKDKKGTTKFSFLISVPIVLASLVMEIFDCVLTNIKFEIDFAIIVSFVSAFFCGIVAIKIMEKITSKLKLKWFGFYLIFVSVFSFFVLK